MKGGGEPVTRLAAIIACIVGQETAIGQHSDETQGGEEISREFVVARRDAPPILEATEAALDDIASL
jgi:hypothetical protein